MSNPDLASTTASHAFSPGAHTVIHHDLAASNTGASVDRLRHALDASIEAVAATRRWVGVAAAIGAVNALALTLTSHDPGESLAIKFLLAAFLSIGVVPLLGLRRGLGIILELHEKMYRIKGAANGCTAQLPGKLRVPQRPLGRLLAIRAAAVEIRRLQGDIWGLRGDLAGLLFWCGPLSLMLSMASAIFIVGLLCAQFLNLVWNLLF